MSEPAAPAAPRLLPARAVGPIVLAIVAAFFAFLAVPRVQATAGLWGAFLVWGTAALAAIGALWLRDRRAGRRLEIEPHVRTPHWVQLGMHTSVFVYWGLYWDAVAAQAPLIVAQVAFAYLCELCVSWRRYGRWRLGFGPWPVVGSTNLFLWWQDPYFAAQFGMIAVIYLSRELFRRRRGGAPIHVFNPSAFGLALAAAVMVVFEVAHLTWGYRISLTLGYPPWCYEWIFAVGLVVMVLFRVTLVTLGAAAAMVAANLVFQRATGVAMYLDTVIPIAVFLGMNLLITDPVTSPRRGAGKLIFGALYGLSVFALYPLLGALGHPPSGDDPGLHVTFLDKLLPVPILNLLAPSIDRLVDRLPSVPWPVRGARANLVHVALWIGFFALIRDDLEAHPGRNLSFWEDACRDRRPRACQTLVMFYERACESGIGEGCHNLGVVLGEGLPDVPADPARATAGFDRGCERGFGPACGALGGSLVRGTGVPPDPAVARAVFTRGCDLGDAVSCAGLAELLLTAGRPDEARARALLSTACDGGLPAACRGRADLLRVGLGGPVDKPTAAALYRRACLDGDGMACNAGALMRWIGDGVPIDRDGALELLDRGCALGQADLCARARALRADGSP